MNKRFLFILLLFVVFLLTGCPSPTMESPTNNTQGQIPTISTYNSSNLKTLSINGVALTPQFTGDQTNYTAAVPFSVDEITITAIPLGEQAQILSGSGIHKLAAGKNSISIVVGAEDGSEREYTITINRAFKAQRVTNNSWYDVPATLLAEGEFVYVYGENAAGISPAEAVAVANEFDANIYDLILDNFGEPSDIDGTGKITILLLDIQDGYSGSGGYVAGYFDPTHIFSRSTYTYSNERDMLYIDVYPLDIDTPNFYNTIAHELQHLVNFNNTALLTGVSQDIWINEGLSAGAEYLYTGEQITSRINFYNTDPYGTIRQGNNFYVWNGFWENPPIGIGQQPDQLANYSTVYLFFQWLRIHANNDTAIYKDILDSTHRDYRAVVDAASSRIDSSLNTWAKVLGTWMEANLLSNRPGVTGLQSYDNELMLQPWRFINTNGAEQLQLSSGEGVAVLTDAEEGSFTYSSGSGANIRYIGIDSDSFETDRTGPEYTGDVVIAFNSNTIINDADQIAVLPKLEESPSMGMLSMQPTNTEKPSSYIIGVQLTPGGGFAPDSTRPDQQDGGSGMFNPERRR